MKLTAKLAKSQLMTNRKRTMWTLIGILLSTAMITSVYGFSASGIEAVVLLRDGNDDFIDTYSTLFIGIGVVLSFIVSAASIIVVSNSFRVSAGERTKQFGILKSVGATKKQIRQTVMYEALWLSAIGIPTGILVGFFVQFVGLQIAEFFLSYLNRINPDMPIVFPFVVAWQAILVSIFMSLITVILSAWLPAYKASKIPAINAIMGIGEIKLNAKHVRANWLVSSLFGIEGQLASKSLKRNKRNLSATVVSLTISIILFIAVTSVGTQMSAITNIAFIDSDTNVLSSFFSSRLIDPETGEAQFIIINNVIAEQVTSRFRQFENTTVVGIGQDTDSFWANVPPEQLTRDFQNMFYQNTETGYFPMQITIVTLDAETYAYVAELAGVPLGSNILINHFRGYDWENNRRVEFTPHIFTYQTLYNTRSDSEFDYLTLHGQIEVLQGELLNLSATRFTVVVPEANVRVYTWFTTAYDPDAFEEYAITVFNEILEPIIVDSDFHATAQVLNIAALNSAEQSIMRLIMVFIYGFVGLLTLIGLTNVISTISTNVRSRSREFAILKSVGMTQEGISRILNLESILCSAKSLLFGIPLGMGASLLTHQVIQIDFGFAYIFPWLAIIQCVIAVFIITWVTMRYASSRLRNSNIIEEVR